MKPTFESTVKILVEAYLNDTLEHGNCYACAVGNIVAANMGHSFVPCQDRTSKKITWDITKGLYAGRGDYGSWYETLGLDFFGATPSVRGRMEIESTGYSDRELIRIENAFEGASWLGDRMFNGLMAVVDVLAEIHGVDLSVKESAKKLFVKA
jgi:hypothetical protein